MFGGWDANGNLQQFEAGEEDGGKRNIYSGFVNRNSVGVPPHKARCVGQECLPRAAVQASVMPGTRSK